MTASPPDPDRACRRPCRAVRHIVDALIAERAPRLSGALVWPLLRPLLMRCWATASRDMADAIAPLSGAGGARLCGAICSP